MSLSLTIFGYPGNLSKLHITAYLLISIGIFAVHLHDFHLRSSPQTLVFTRIASAEALQSRDLVYIISPTMHYRVASLFPLPLICRYHVLPCTCFGKSGVQTGYCDFIWGTTESSSDSSYIISLLFNSLNTSCLFFSETSA